MSKLRNTPHALYLAKKRMKFQNFQHPEFVNKIKGELDSALDPVYGMMHWVEVYQNAQLLAKHYGVSSGVFEYFAILHDFKRENIPTDHMHGTKAYVEASILKDRGHIELDEEEVKKLRFACHNHSYPKDEKNHPLWQDIIVQICLDANKLDITRKGKRPSASYMITKAAKMLCR